MDGCRATKRFCFQFYICRGSHGADMLNQMTNKSKDIIIKLCKLCWATSLLSIVFVLKRAQHWAGPCPPQRNDFLFESHSCFHYLHQLAQFTWNTKGYLCTLPFASAWLGCGTLSEGIICMRWARMENEPDTCTARCVVQVSGETRFIGHGREEFGVLCFSLRWMLHAWYKTVLLRETDGRLGVNYIYSLWNYFHINISSPDELGDISKMAIMNIVVWLETDLITDSLQWHMHLP